MKNLFYKLLILTFISLNFMSSVKADTPFIGEIQAFGFNFCPTGWLPADGSLINISQNTALFSLLGTNYGGNGTINFALPDLRGRTLIGTGQGTGLTNRNLGAVGGTENETLTVEQMPVHSHGFSLIVKRGRAVTTNPVNSYLAEAGIFRPSNSQGDTVSVLGQGTELQGGSQAHNNMPPFLGITYCIATQGIFPSRP